MKHYRRSIAALLLILVLLSHPIAAAAGVTDADSAWRQYLEQDTDLKPGYQFPHASCFRAAAVTHDLPETLLLAVARGESDFDATARSRANAHGVMQILWPGTANDLGIHRLARLYDPCTNIDAGTRYLKQLLQRFDGNLHLALAAYNYGPQRISADTANIPSGAMWYSDYIFRHLNYILGDRESESDAGEHLYSELGRSTLVSFAEPYRAEAFVTRLERYAPDLQLDWFRKGVGEFSVVLIYEDREQFQNSARLLAGAGFPLE